MTTTATGKSGRYQYYKCNTRIGRGFGACCTPAVPMKKMDDLVLAEFADKVLTPKRLREMLQEMNHSGQVNRAFPLDVAHYIRYRIFRRYRDHHVHMIGHQVPLFDPAILMLRQSTKHLTEMHPQLTVQHFSSILRMRLGIPS